VGRLRFVVRVVGRLGLRVQVSAITAAGKVVGVAGNCRMLTVPGDIFGEQLQVMMNSWNRVSVFMLIKTDTTGPPKIPRRLSRGLDWPIGVGCRCELVPRHQSRTGHAAMPCGIPTTLFIYLPFSYFLDSFIARLHRIGPQAYTQGRRHGFESGGDNCASGASGKIFDPPTFWPVGGGQNIA